MRADPALFNSTAALVLVLLLASCAHVPPKKAEEGARLTPVSYADLPGWAEDDILAALPALQKSCAVKKAPEWLAACDGLTLAMDAAVFRAFLEARFTPHAVRDAKGETEGLFTGYYVPLLRGSYRRHAPYLTPLYARPPDLVTVDLGAFKEELKGKSITGRVKDGKLVPYYTREQISKGALKKSPKLAFVDDAADAFFLHIQGSGVVAMEEGGTVRAGYAAQNGHPYTAIGKTLIERGELTKETVSMPAIRDWLEKNPDEAQGLMNANPSYVFFRPLDGGAVGAEGVELTAGRSLAVDPKSVPYGAPVFLDAEDPDGGRIQRLMVAQDTGGAIRGAVRGDVFWGTGEVAADKAGKMKSKGRYFVLLPK
jgi:membrane-bound lytic murein transglycosylase A